MTKVYISDHALLRYVERKYGLPFDTFRAELEALLRGAAPERILDFVALAVKDAVMFDCFLAIGL